MNGESGDDSSIATAAAADRALPLLLLVWSLEPGVASNFLDLGLVVMGLGPLSISGGGCTFRARALDSDRLLEEAAAAAPDLRPPSWAPRARPPSSGSMP